MTDVTYEVVEDIPDAPQKGTFWDLLRELPMSLVEIVSPHTGQRAYVDRKILHPCEVQTVTFRTKTVRRGQPVVWVVRPTNCAFEVDRLAKEVRTPTEILGLSEKWVTARNPSTGEVARFNLQGNHHGGQDTYLDLLDLEWEKERDLQIKKAQRAQAQAQQFVRTLSGINLTRIFYEKPDLLPQILTLLD